MAEQARESPSVFAGSTPHPTPPAFGAQRGPGRAGPGADLDPHSPPSLASGRAAWERPRGSQVQAAPPPAEGAAFGVDAGVHFGRLALTSHLGLKGLEGKGRLRGGPGRAQPWALRPALGRERECPGGGCWHPGRPPQAELPLGDLPRLQSRVVSLEGPRGQEARRRGEAGPLARHSVLPSCPGAGGPSPASLPLSAADLLPPQEGSGVRVRVLQ